MSRQIALDTETTGFDYKEGDRLVEIGCVEMIDRELTGNNFHIYINPERDMPQEAFEVHGLSEEFLKEYPIFKDQAENFLNYIGDAELIIHNAPFDLSFLDGELAALGLPTVSERCSVIDTLVLANSLYPGRRNNLDALCNRLSVDNSDRTLHGALIDSVLLAQVYLRMTGGQESLFTFDEEQSETGELLLPQAIEGGGKGRIILPSEEERRAHLAFMAQFDSSK